MVIVPNQLLIYRTGQANAYPRTLPIRNVYQGGSLLVARVFLLQPKYEAVNDVYQAICARSRTIALSTVSRVLQQLEEDLVVSREGRKLRLLQPDVLLEQLAASYRPPRTISRFVGKSPLPLEEIARRLAHFAARSNVRVTLTGAASVNRYAIMAREPMLSIYTEGNPEATAKEMELLAEPTNRFPNVELLQTTDDPAYFDRRTAPDGVFASPIQAWLELTTGDKRQRDVAAQICLLILSDIARAGEEARNAP